MRKYFLILLVLSTNAIFVGCAHNSEKEGVLEKRAGYTLQAEDKQKPIIRTKGKVKKAWLHAHEMPTGDYFGGSWVYLLVEQTTWNIPESN